MRDDDGSAVVDADEDEAAEDQTEDELCGVCMGCGQGRFEGSTCYACGGTGRAA